jgi:hypothetical protein
MRLGHLLAVLLVFAGLVGPSVADEVVYGPPMSVGRQWHTATKLHDGKVLICGGLPSVGSGVLGTTSADVYDPVAGTITPVGSMKISRWVHNATLLADGKVLITGGLLGYTAGQVHDTAEIYDPSSQTFTLLVSTMSAPRFHQTATRLADGRVLIAGGQTSDGSMTASVDIFDPATISFSRVGELAYPRHTHNAVLLPSGDSVLIVGGETATAPVAPAEIISASGARRLVGQLYVPRFYTQSELLPDGRVIVVGGTASGNVYSSAVEFFDVTHEEFFPWKSDIHLLQGRSRRQRAPRRRTRGLLRGPYHEHHVHQYRRGVRPQ